MSQLAELRIALTAARAAAEVILRLYKDFEAIAEPRIDISTQADRDAQEKILQILHAEFPTDALCAEEQTAGLNGAAHIGERLWVVDPIDGTRGFASKNGEFSVMIGFVRKGELAIGVVLEPALSRVTFAEIGGGCWREDGAGCVERCGVTGASTLTAATLVQSHARKGKPSEPARLLQTGRVVETFSAGVKLARVARGEADLYVSDYNTFHDWDLCAGHLLVEEAGGQVTGLGGEVIRYGRPGALQTAGIVASNGRVHAEAVARLAPLAAGR